MAEGPLNGIVIIDMSRVLAGPYCTRLLANLGARVIKIEVPERGDDARHYGPFIDQKSVYFTAMNYEKESIALDLKDTEDKALLDGLLAHADVLVENFRPGVMQRLGYGWNNLHKNHPSLIYCSVSGFGHTGPYQNRPAYDMVVQGMGGIMSITGHPDGEPTRVGMSIGDIGSGIYAAVGINAALYERSNSGIGRHIDLSMLDCQIALVENAVARYSSTGEIPGPLGARHPSITPFGAFETSDGHIIIAVGNEHLFVTLCKTIDAPDLLADDRYRSNEQRTNNETALKTQLNERFRQKTTAKWLSLLGEAGVPSGPINNIDEIVNDPQVAARNMVVDVNEPGLPGMRVAGNPIKISGFHDPAEREGAPTLDQNRAELIAEFDL